MTISYEEYDTTFGNWYSDLITKIVAHGSWDDVFAVSLSTATTASTSSGSTALTVSSTAGFAVGDPIRLVGGTTGTTYYRTVTAISSGTSMTMSASFGATETTGTTVAYFSSILKATTSDGAQMVVEMARSETAYRLMYRTHYTHTGSVSGGASSWKQVLFHGNGSALAIGNAMHCILSLSEDHLFVSLEGPRANETNAFSAQYGSARQYMFVSSITRYRDADPVPAVFAWGNILNVAAAYTNKSFMGEVSRNYGNSLAWVRARLATMMVPIFSTNSTTAVATTFNSVSAIDNKVFLWPYVVVEDGDSLRGRLKMFWYVGNNRGALGDDPLTNPGELITHNGVVYKTLAVGKGDGSLNGSGAFGWFQGTSYDVVFGSPIVAVPYANA